MKIILEKGKRINLCFKRFGEIQMFKIEDVIKRENDVYARLKEITYHDIDNDLNLLRKIPDCIITNSKVV